MRRIRSVAPAWDNGSRKLSRRGGGTCGDGIFSTGNLCTGTVTDPEILEGMSIVATYTSHDHGALVVPIEITSVYDGGFTFEIQDGSTFSWLGKAQKQQQEGVTP